MKYGATQKGCKVKTYIFKSIARGISAAALGAFISFSGIASGQTTDPAPDSPRTDRAGQRDSRDVDNKSSDAQQDTSATRRSPRADRSTTDRTSQVRARRNQTSQLRNSDGKLVRNIDSNRPVLGVRIEDADQGVTITKVKKDSPAKKAGLKVGHHVVALNGQNVTSTKQLISKLSSIDSKKNVKLSVMRNGEKQEMTVGLSTYGEIFGNAAEVARKNQTQPRREAFRPNFDAKSDTPKRETRNNAASDDLDLPKVPANDAANNSAASVEEKVKAKDATTEKRESSKKQKRDKADAEVKKDQESSNEKKSQKDS